MSDITTLLPEKLASTALGKELAYYLDSVRDYSVAESTTNIEGIDQRVDYVVNEILNKYKDPTELSLNELTHIFSEQGYEYLLEVLNLSEEEKLSQYQTMVSFIPLIHALKGHRRGVELIMDLITQGSLSEYSIMEWWEDTVSNPLPAKGTAVVTLDFADPSLVGFDTLDRLKAFFLSYVYAQVTLRVSSGGVASSRAYIHTETRQTHDSTTATAVL